MMISPEYIAAAAALGVFAFVLSALHATNARRRREEELRQWQADLRSRGA